MRFTTPAPDGKLFRRVLALARTARDTVGFLPDSAFRDRAFGGTLLACVAEDDGQELLGYALYDLPRDEIRLGQLVVASRARDGGVARALVDEIEARHSPRRGIFLYCRNDFPATEMWPRIGFVARDERAGRSFEGHPLTLWWRDFGHANLFTSQAEVDARPVAVLDACVFFDLVGSNPNRALQELRSDWITEHAQLGVTAHLYEEIRRGADSVRRRQERTAARALELPGIAGSSWRAVLAQLKAMHPGAAEKDRDDLTHLAYAIAHQATWMVTSDRSFRGRYANAALDMASVKLVSPAEVVREIDEVARGDAYSPRDLAGTDMSRREVDAGTLAGLAERFVNHQRGERIRDLRSRIDAAAAQASHVRLQLVEVDSQPRGLLGFEHSRGTTFVRFVRVSRGVGDTTVARHLLAMIRNEAATSGSSRIVVQDTAVPTAISRSYADEGFFAERGQPVEAYPITGIGTLNDLDRRLATIGAQTATERLGDPATGAKVGAEAEIAYAPFRILGMDFPTFVVPIKPAWATALFDSRLAEEQLFHREWTLGLRRELVYYRSPHASGGIRAPARILWYVSGVDSPGGAEVRAVSQLRDVLVAPAEHLYRRFERLGTYTLDQVVSRADSKGRAMALRFSHTHEFRRPVRLDELRRILTGDPKSRSVVLQSPRLIDEHTFATIMGLGFPDDV
ncbi:MAG: GNAT family N-acetyltransferase [Thermoleophilaceae bacterium]